MRDPLEDISRRHPVIAAAVAVVVLAVAALFITVEIVEEQPTREFALGIQSDGLLQNPDERVRRAAFEDVERAGASLVRIALSWQQVAHACGGASDEELRDHTSDCYDWSLYDSVVGMARERNLGVMASVWKTPDWANGGRGRAHTGETEEEFERVSDAYSAFMGAAATRYGPDSRVGSIDIWTVWNEPNSRRFWLPMSEQAPARFAQLYVEAAAAIRDAHAAASVAPGPMAPRPPGTSIMPLDWVEKVQSELQFGGDSASQTGALALDAWSVNGYTGRHGPRDEGPDPPSVDLRSIDNLFAALDDAPETRGLPVWLPEYAWETDPPDGEFGIPLDEQAERLADGLEVAYRTGRIPVVVWYVLRDPDDLVDYQSGLITADGGDKPAFEMFQRPISVTRSADDDRRLELFGMSNVDPRRGELVWSIDGQRWRRVDEQKRNGRVVTGSIEDRDGLLVAVRDRDGRGPSRSAEDSP